MTSSIVDGEDLVQEALLHAHPRLEHRRTNQQSTIR
jgi:DNA-directed RNA polymerase specialized sigma24 family protein